MSAHEKGGPTTGAANPEPTDFSVPDDYQSTFFIDYPGLWTYLSSIPSFEELCRRRGEIQLYGGRLIPVVIP